MSGRLFLLFLAGAVFASALGVVYSKHQSRKLFVQLQQLQRQRDEMDVYWSRLQLEQSTYATHGRIEEYARNELNMMTPKQGDVVILKP
jgi:cell division protein FtsL